MVKSPFLFLSCANRGLMAQTGKTAKPERTRCLQGGKLGETFGGTDFLIAGTGAGFNVPNHLGGVGERVEYQQKHSTRHFSNFFMLARGFK
jgi:hypothetical protein